MKVFRVMLPVGDIDAASTFYGEVFGSPGERVGVNRHYFDGESVVVACIQPGDKPAVIPNPEHLYLSTTDPLESVRDTWTAGGGSIDDDIRDRDWGETSFYGRDPWGNKVVFVVAGTEFTGGRFVP
jgi:catechol 2,3-dioxygenase-like lactoylglutathione lyase family enzyme